VKAIEDLMRTARSVL